ncbi:MAG TPA: AAA family ATPase [Pseudomonadota bacterium]|nr:AAA family ATPase [Pseudomonadota bacterium]
MYKNLTLTNFRGFRRFTMENLGRINLLVGTNNCGKTTVLEAIKVLADYPDPTILGVISVRRGAVQFPGDAESEDDGRIALRHLFFGHKVQIGTQFVIEGQQEAEHPRVSVRLTDRPQSLPGALRPEVSKDLLWLVINKEGSDAPAGHSVQLTSDAEWPIRDFADRRRLVLGRFHVAQVQSGGLSGSAIAEEMSAIALNPEEQMVLQVLRILSPDIEGVTTVSVPRDLVFRRDRLGIYVKLKGQRERVPIGTLGDGLWRLLGLALALVKARGSVLLVDEIEIGLHYTAQVDMWRMVKQAAEELDVQVFATTHSRDCILALAAIARPDVTTGSEVTIQRIEGERAISYSEREIVLAAERGIEVR